GEERTVAGAMFLMAGATLVHWNFTVMILAILVGLGVLLVPESVRARREGRALLRTPSGRLGLTVAGSAAASAAAFGFVPSGPRAPALGAPQFTDKIHREVPQYRFAALGPAAAIGA